MTSPFACNYQDSSESIKRASKRQITLLWWRNCYHKKDNALVTEWLNTHDFVSFIEPSHNGDAIFCRFICSAIWVARKYGHCIVCDNVSHSKVKWVISVESYLWRHLCVSFIKNRRNEAMFVFGHCSVDLFLGLFLCGWRAWRSGQWKRVICEGVYVDKLQRFLHR